MAKIADYFTQSDRKKLFFDYLKLLGILEIVIFIVVALWATDDKYHRVYTPFPWREYLFVAFAFPVIITFLMGVIITGFNYFMGAEPEPTTAVSAEVEGDDRLSNLIGQMRRLPYLGLLFLLLVTILALYNMNHIMVWIASLGEKTFIFLTYVLAGLGGLAALYMIFFMIFKYKLNKKHMEYQYYSEISDKFGLIILDDRTVIHKDGKLLILGRKWRRARQVGKLPSDLNLVQPQGGADERLPVPKP
ncbi:MAG: hypothetical protein JRI57_10445 [Deltaproteobacteria bacterium]|nr:hypothetical protein [Deltaproteobacteria bacterium]MBW1951598.1 hypothetical protein [Deltaproteobacteria bacterium]MBW1986615.1 hypothetical protein [Deltaproteobacteria bacterium]MBW2134784.1 hypothetical protein [Deltaproteobacteria bacterium]